MTFEEHCAAVDVLALKCGALDAGQSYTAQTGVECWREGFDDGMTPAEAWSEEMWASADMLG